MLTYKKHNSKENHVVLLNTNLEHRRKNNFFMCKIHFKLGFKSVVKINVLVVKINESVVKINVLVAGNQLLK